MVHRDGSTHEWVPGRAWDLIVTSDDATGRVYSGFCVEEEGTWSSFRGVRETVEAKGVFASLYTDRGSHYRHTPKAGGKVDKGKPTQFGRAMGELGIEMIPWYSPRARGRCERLFRTLQGLSAQRAGPRGDRGRGGGQRVPERVLAAVQRGVRGGGGRGRDGVRAAAGGGAGRHPVPAGDADGRQRQLRVVRWRAAPGSSPNRTGSTTSGRRFGCTSTRTGVWRCSTRRSAWAATTGRDVRRVPSTGRRGIVVRRPMAPAPARLRSHDVQTGHVTCYKTGQLHCSLH